MRKTVVKKDNYQWHDWFAWYPVFVNTGNCKGTWLFWEKVQRRFRGTYGGLDIQFRNLNGSDLL